MQAITQTQILKTVEQNKYGTFRDSMRAPIHRWFAYPAGYSHIFVKKQIEMNGLENTSLVLDPFLGSGTTCLVAKELGINSVGIEAHPFVAWVAKTKIFWDYDFGSLRSDFSNIIMKELFEPAIKKQAEEEFTLLPELVKKCFSRQNLLTLLKLRFAISESVRTQVNKDFLNLVLTSTLRTATKAGTGWPYIAPSKYHEKSEKDGLVEFKKKFELILTDVSSVKKGSRKSAKVTVIEGDSRVYHTSIGKNKVDLAITSPPYLNNYDYADRTRFETYFFGMARNWNDITENVRKKLIVASTTQTNRTLFDVTSPLSKDLVESCPKLAVELAQKIKELSERRLVKRGKKSYDIMVSQYFSDLWPIIKNVSSYLKRNGKFVLVLGDSAPYGVHIPTETYIGEMGLRAGFSDYELEELRTRGDKWKHNSQRHKVQLRECVLTLKK